MDEPQTYWNSWSSGDLNCDVERGDEHPSGLRDAIRKTMSLTSAECGRCMTDEFAAAIEASVVAWLSVVSEGEIEAAARAMYDASWRPGASHALSWDDTSDEYRTDARAALAASRGVLLPKET